MITLRSDSARPVKNRVRNVVEGSEFASAHFIGICCCSLIASDSPSI